VLKRALPPIPADSERTKKRCHAESERFWAKLRREILLELVNVDDSCNQFRKRYPMLDVSVNKDDSAILRFRDDLREIWVSGNNTILHAWIKYLRSQNLHSWVVGTWADGTPSVQPNYLLLPLSLAIAVSEWRSKMCVCGNPECPQKYFLKGRRTQRFCDRWSCSAYGQRQHKLRWWKAHKSEIRKRLRGSVSRRHREEKDSGHL
jgi:hypothetical protein